MWDTVEIVDDHINETGDDAIKATWLILRNRLLNNSPAHVNNKKGIFEMYNRWLLTECKSKEDSELVRSFCDYITNH